MTAPTLISVAAAFAVGSAALFVGRTLLIALSRYREAFEHSAEHNLAQLYLFIEPERLFALNVLLMMSVVIAVLMMGGNGFIATVIATATGASPPFIYWFLRRRRRRRAVEQLPDALLSMATNLRSGLSLSQALETTIEHESAPLGQELALVLRELRIGVDFDEAIENLHVRIPEIEVQLVSSAMKVSREIGGNLSETLERISDTLRKRLQMEGKIRSLTAQGRLQGVVMVALPIFLMTVLSQMEPRAMHYLFHAWYGWATLGVIFVMEAVGFHFIRKIVNIDV